MSLKGAKIVHISRTDMTKFNRRFHGNAGDGHLHTHHIWTPEVLPFHMTPSYLLCRGGETNPIFWALLTGWPVDYDLVTYIVTLLGMFP